MGTCDQQASQPTVLCVDDEPHILNALRRSLHQYCCRVVTAGSGAEAIELLRDGQIDVLICDEAMPGMRGIEVLQQAKAIAPETRRILLTAHCADEDVVLPAVNQGEVFRLLAKPWEEDQLRQAITDALGAEPAEWVRQRQRVHARLTGRE